MSENFGISKNSLMEKTGIRNGNFYFDENQDFLFES